MEELKKANEFCGAHEDQVTSVVMENELLRGAWFSYLVYAPSAVIKAMAGDPLPLASLVQCMMGLAFCIGQQDSGEKVLDEWLGVAEEGEDG